MLGRTAGRRTEITSHRVATPCSSAWFNPPWWTLPHRSVSMLKSPCLPGRGVERAAPERSCGWVVALHLWRERKSDTLSTSGAEMKLDVNAFQAMKANLLTNLGCISFFPSSHSEQHYQYLCLCHLFPALLCSCRSISQQPGHGRNKEAKAARKEMWNMGTGKRATVSGHPGEMFICTTSLTFSPKRGLLLNFWGNSGWARESGTVGLWRWGGDRRMFGVSRKSIFLGDSVPFPAHPVCLAFPSWSLSKGTSTHTSLLPCCHWTTQNHNQLSPADKLTCYPRF